MIIISDVWNYIDSNVHAIFEIFVSVPVIMTLLYEEQMEQWTKLWDGKTLNKFGLSFDDTYIFPGEQHAKIHRYILQYSLSIYNVSFVRAVTVNKYDSLVIAPQSTNIELYIYMILYYPPPTQRQTRTRTQTPHTRRHHTHAWFHCISFVIT